MPETEPSALLAAYLEKRDDLRRYFAARLGSVPAAEDLVQELYFKIAATPEGEEVRNPGAYLYRLGSNLMLDRLRQQKREVRREDDWYRAGRTVAGGQDVADLPGAEDAVAAKQRLARIVEALNDLSPQTRRVFRMHKFDGMSHVEVAAALGISRSAVEKHVSAALKHLLARPEP